MKRGSLGELYRNSEPPLPAGFQRQSPRSSQRRTQHSKAIPAFNLSPSQLPRGRGPGDFLPQGLGSETGQGQEAADCGLGQSVGFLPSRSSVFCLPWAEKPLSAPTCLALQHQAHPQSTRKTAVWLKRPLVATVQMIVTGAKIRNRCA